MVIEIEETTVFSNCGSASIDSVTFIFERSFGREIFKRKYSRFGSCVISTRNSQDDVNELSVCLCLFQKGAIFFSLVPKNAFRSFQKENQSVMLILCLVK